MENLGVKNIFYRVSKFGRLLKTRETRHPKGDPTYHWVGSAELGQGSTEPWWLGTTCQAPVSTALHRL